MNKNLFNLLICLLLISCGSSHNESKVTLLGVNNGLDTMRSFSVIKKDSARINHYRFEKKLLENGVIIFNYTGKEDAFSLSCDTLANKYKEEFVGSDTSALEVEKAQYYTIYGNDYKVLKLIGAKNVTDGAFSVFINSEFGLLLNKSNTWRSAKIVCPDKDSPNYAALTTLLYRIQTDHDFFYDSIPDVKKFTTPEVE